MISNQTKKEDNSKLSINQKLALDLSDYSKIAEKIYLDSEINAPVVLNIIFNIHTVASTQKGLIEDNISPALVIPIGENVFKIEGEPVATGEDKISEITKIPVPVNKTKVGVLLIASFILIVLAGITYRIKQAPPPDEFEKQIERIFKEYSERLAGLEHTLSYQLSENINVNSIEDMIKIADEVGQPVFYYKVDNDTERKIEFFVFDNAHTYYLVIFGDIKA